MAQPLVASFRAEILYDVTIGGQVLQHKYQPYGRVIDAGVGITPRYRFLERGGTSAVDWKTYINRWATLASALFEPGSTIPWSAELQSLVSSEWLPLDSVNGVMTGSAPTGATNQKALQGTATFRDTAFRVLRDIVLESALAPIQKFKTIATLPTAVAAYYAAYTAASTDSLDPFNWIVSRSNLYLAESGFRGLSIFTNRKIARRRGI